MNGSRHTLQLFFKVNLNNENITIQLSTNDNSRGDLKYITCTAVTRCRRASKKAILTVEIREEF